MFPEPEAVKVPPPAPTQRYVQVSDAGKVCATVEPVASLGPALEAVMLEVTEPPGMAVVTAAVLVIESSVLAASVSVSVAELLHGVGAVPPPPSLPARRSSELPVAAAEMVQLAV